MSGCESGQVGQCLFFLRSEKMFTPFRCKFFPFSVDPFSEGTGAHESNQEVTDVVSLIYNCREITNF